MEAPNVKDNVGVFVAYECGDLRSTAGSRLARTPSLYDGPDAEIRFGRRFAQHLKPDWDVTTARPNEG